MESRISGGRGRGIVGCKDLVGSRAVRRWPRVVMDSVHGSELECFVLRHHSRDVRKYPVHCNPLIYFVLAARVIIVLPSLVCAPRSATGLEAKESGLITTLLLQGTFMASQGPPSGGGEVMRGV
jgi:hypothetical protein